MAKILVAEDEMDIRELIRLTLEFSGHEVGTARDGLEAVDIVSQDNSYDLILMDVRMPRMTGYEACRQLKQKASTKHIPVVFLSAKGQEAEVETGLALGAADYILKPFAPDFLIKEIGKILAEKVRN